MWVENNRDQDNAFNLGLKMAQGVYVAHTNAADLIHPDRLKIQYALMESEPSLIVCDSYVSLFGPDNPPDNFVPVPCGKIGRPLLAFLKGNFLYHQTTMLRKSFLMEHHLQYTNDPYT